MSFCSDCKNEIMKGNNFPDCCLSSMLYGAVMFFAKIGRNEFSLSSENIDVINYIKDSFVRYGIDLTEENIEKGKKFNYLHITDKAQCSRLFSDFGLANTAPAYDVDPGMFLCENCAKAFICGAFLSSGSVTEPSKGYHLEFSTHRIKVAHGIIEILDRMGFEPKLTRRGYDNVIYFKSSEQIEDLLATMGAYTGSMNIMEAKIYKDVRNNVTRKVNFESSNLEKTVKASAEDAALFTEFMEKGGASIISDDMLKIANLRIENPECSLSELALMIEGITKSGVNHRLRKLRETAKDYIDNHS